MQHELDKVTRLEIIDHSPCKNCLGQCFVITDANKREECIVCHGMGSKGREVVFWDKSLKVQISIQDDGRTLKLFISERNNAEQP